MGWREKMGGSGSGKVNPETYTKNAINPKKDPDQTISSISSMGIENEKSGYPIPQSEAAFTEDERQAIIDVDGGQDTKPVEYPVAIKMESAILGATVDLMLWPDRAEVDGVQYSNEELKNLIGRKPSAADLQTIHEAKKQFDGGVTLSNQI